nr:hypothetical protein [Bacteroidota bacterium]
MNKLSIPVCHGILIMACLLLSVSSAWATHVMGSDITWKSKGKDTFEITVSVYRDCNGVDLSATPISITPTCGGQIVSVGGSISGGLDITPVCKSSCTRCSDLSCDFPFGIEQYQITATVYLGNYNCCTFNIAWEQCCRNNAITTGPSGSFYVEAMLNRCVTPYDNSPYFTNPPVAIY